MVSAIDKIDAALEDTFSRHNFSTLPSVVVCVTLLSSTLKSPAKQCVDLK